MSCRAFAGPLLNLDVEFGDTIHALSYLLCSLSLFWIAVAVWEWAFALKTKPGQIFPPGVGKFLEKPL